VLLAADVGNTNTVLGLFAGEEIVAEWRVSTRLHDTADELDVQLAALLERRALLVDDIEGAVVACTVPALAAGWSTALERVAGRPAVVVGPGVKTGMPLLYSNPAEIGPDRIANAVAAFDRVGDACIVVDFGTSTNFDVVSAAGEFVGGVLAPGLEVSMEALAARASRLATVELVAPPQTIGKTTSAALQAGAVFGFAGLVDGLVGRIQGELGRDCAVIATGGLAPTVAPHAHRVTESVPGLTLVGLRLLWERNKGGESNAR
jgi:type III pantothenate kinase